MAITLRSTKGSALTHTEMDTNFSELDSRIVDSAGIATIARTVALDSAEAFQLLLDSSEIINLIDSSYINTYATNPAAVSSLIAGEGYIKFDSTDAVGIIDSHVGNTFLSTRVDSAYVALRAPDYTTYYEDEVKGTVDSDYVILKQRKYTFAGDFQADTIALIDSNYVQLRQSLDSASVTGLIDSAYIQARQIGADQVDSAVVLSLSLANIVEDSSPALGGDLNMNGFANVHAFNLGASGTSAYIFTDTRNRFFPTSENNPTLYLRRGDAYIFINNTGAHPLEIQDSDGNSYDTGVTNNRDSNATGNVTIVPSMSAPLRLRYQCTSHDSMAGIINIV